MSRVIYQDRDIIFANDPKSIVVNATVTEIDDDKLHVKGDLLHTAYIADGTTYLSFLMSLDQGLRDKIIDKSNFWYQSPNANNKPKVLNHIYLEERGMIAKLIKFLIEGLSFDLIKVPKHFITVPKMKSGHYTTGFTKPVDMEITGQEYNTISLLQNAKVTIKNIIE